RGAGCLRRGDLRADGRVVADRQSVTPDVAATFADGEGRGERVQSVRGDGGVQHTLLRVGHVDVRRDLPHRGAGGRRGDDRGQHQAGGRQQYRGSGGDQARPAAQAKNSHTYSSVRDSTGKFRNN